ncbi:MAG: hypothetical protein Q8R83_05990 [Legionellaceae bacterium]|nr:hypothetical protein [Legionellaceae bacterium]
MSETQKYAILTPSISSILNKGKEITHQVSDTLASITEEVEVLSISQTTGNAKVRDSRGRVFYCSCSDLKNI